MEVENTNVEETTTESTSTTTPETESEVTQTTAAETGAEGTTDAKAAANAVDASISGVVAKDATQVANAFKPNFSFKVKDKEHQIDDFLKSAIKDAETEKKVKELYEKAYGLDEVKAHRQKIQEQLQAIEPKYQSVEKSLQALGSFVQKKDYRSFFEALQIPKDDILRYAVEELKFRELPPEQKAAIENQRQQEQQFMMANEYNQKLQNDMEALVMKQAQFELQQEISKPEISAAAQAFDARVGQPGAFMAQVIQRGSYYEKVHGQSKTAKELIDEVSMIAGLSPQGMPAGNQTAPQGNATAPQPKPVIKSFNGSNASSPVKKVFSSIDEIRKHRQNMANA